MQDMIKEIVDMDRKAREITDAAQLEKVTPKKRWRNAANGSVKSILRARVNASL